MDKKNLVRYKAGLAALMIASGMTLGGCARRGFEYTTKDSKYVVADGSTIGNDCINDCYVVEAYNSLTEETEIFIARKRNFQGYYYCDLMNHNNYLFRQDNIYNNFLEFVKETPLYNYMIALDLLQANYSYEDMQKIYEEIKSVYTFEEEKKLVK
ncbi:MAG: hypothetical protein MSH29_05230 [Tenericutes bacterium]|nr:hypothetical protein [Mycoplasmatota bacterium]